MVRRYYRRIVIDGADRIPAEGPVLLCANHPNSLFDPVLVGMAARRPVRFLAKAPLFKIPVVGRLLYALGMIPAYRGRDDSRQIRRNLESLDVAAEVLREGGALGIFPEGFAHDRLAIEMVRSGTARIILSAAGAEGGQLVVVPLGLNFENKEMFRSDVWVRVGQPLRFPAWLEGRDAHPKRLIRELTAELEAGLKQCAIHLDEATWEPWLRRVEPFVELPADGRDGTQTASAPAALRRRKRIADAMNAYMAESAEQAAELAESIERFARASRAAGLDPGSRRLHGEGGAASPARLMIGWLLVIALAPLAAAGAIHHLLPFVISRALARRFHARTNRTDVSFYRLLFSLPVYAIAYALAALLIGWWRGGAAALAWTLLMPVCGVVAFEFVPLVKRCVGDTRDRVRLSSGRPEVRDLLEQRAALASRLEALLQRFQFGKNQGPPGDSASVH